MNEKTLPNETVDREKHFKHIIRGRGYVKLEKMEANLRITEVQV